MVANTNILHVKINKIAEISLLGNLIEHTFCPTPSRTMGMQTSDAPRGSAMYAHDDA